MTSALPQILAHMKKGCDSRLAGFILFLRNGIAYFAFENNLSHKLDVDIKNFVSRYSVSLAVLINSFTLKFFSANDTFRSVFSPAIISLDVHLDKAEISALENLNLLPWSSFKIFPQKIGQSIMEIIEVNLNVMLPNNSITASNNSLTSVIVVHPLFFP